MELSCQPLNECSVKGSPTIHNIRKLVSDFRWRRSGFATVEEAQLSDCFTVWEANDVPVPCAVAQAGCPSKPYKPTMRIIAGGFVTARLSEDSPPGQYPLACKRRQLSARFYRPRSPFHVDTPGPGVRRCRIQCVHPNLSRPTDHYSAICSR